MAVPMTARAISVIAANELLGYSDVRTVARAKLSDMFIKMGISASAVRVGWLTHQPIILSAIGDVVAIVAVANSSPSAKAPATVIVVIMRSIISAS